MLTQAQLHQREDNMKALITAFETLQATANAVQKDGYIVVMEHNPKTHKLCVVKTIINTGEHSYFPDIPKIEKVIRAMDEAEIQLPTQDYNPFNGV
jgi:hypothetical protein